MMNRFLPVFCVLVLLPMVSAKAELPPSAYEEMQKAAPEYVTIEVLRVQVEPGSEAGQQNVTAVALVESVERTGSDLKAGDLITISYTLTERPQNWVGPGEVPVLTEREKTLAYLKKTEESSTYAPAAGRMSFSNF